MRYTVLQFDLSDHVVNGNFVNKEVERKHFEATFKGDVDPVLFISSYKEVCAIEAKDLDEVFEIGNIGPEEKIERFDRMHSISVGDVIKTETHECYVVTPVGFKRIPISSPNGRQWTAEQWTADLLPHIIRG